MSYRKYIMKYKKPLFLDPKEHPTWLAYIGAFLLQALILLLLLSLWLSPTAGYGVTNTATSITIPVTEQVIISESQYAEILKHLHDLKVLEEATPTFEFGTIPIHVTNTGVTVPDTVPATMTLGFYQYSLDIHLNPKIIDNRQKKIFTVSPSVQAAINELPSIGIAVHINWKQIEGGINFTRSSLSFSTYSVLPYLAWRLTDWLAIGVDCSWHLLVLF